METFKPVCYPESHGMSRWACEVHQRKGDRLRYNIVPIIRKQGYVESAQHMSAKVYLGDVQGNPHWMKGTFWIGFCHKPDCCCRFTWFTQQEGDAGPHCPKCSPQLCNMKEYCIDPVKG